MKVSRKFIKQKVAIFVATIFFLNILFGYCGFFNTTKDVYANTGKDMLAYLEFTEALVGSTGVSDGLKKESSTFGVSGDRTSGFTGSSQTIYVNGWNDADTTDKYWYLETSTHGYENLEFSFGAYGTNTSPKDFVLEFSTSSTGTFTEVSTYELQNTYPIPRYTFNLPAEANNLDVLYIRMRATTTASIGG